MATANNLRKLLFTFLLGLLCSSSFAETPQERIIATNEKLAAMKAKQAELDLEAQIASKQAEIRKLKGQDRFAAKGGEMRPTVKSIEGIDKKKMATIRYASGEEETVRVGDFLRSGWKVTAIDLRTVSLVRKRERTRLFVSSGTGVGTMSQVTLGRDAAPAHPGRTGTPEIPVIPNN